MEVSTGVYVSLKALLTVLIMQVERCISPSTMNLASGKESQNLGEPDNLLLLELLGIFTESSPDDLSTKNWMESSMLIFVQFREIM